MNANAWKRPCATVETHLRKENIRLRTTIEDRRRFGDIVGQSPAMQEVYELMLMAASSDTNIILYGESGTGKELVARAIHNMSARQDHRFIPVNCGRDSGKFAGKRVFRPLQRRFHRSGFE